jgi:endonuclease V-like protein UPF0215 family
MKQEIRILGIDDAPFDKFRDKGKNLLVVGTIYRGGNYMDGLLSTKIKVDGSNSTSQLIKMVNQCKFKPQIRAIILDGIALGGFNIIDIEKLHKKTSIPVIVVIRRMPDFRKIKETLKKLKIENKYQLIEKAGKPVKINSIYVQFKGITKEQAKEIIKLSSIHSLLPEPIRVAHIIASGIKEGQSRGRA